MIQKILLYQWNKKRQNKLRRMKSLFRCKDKETWKELLEKGTFHQRLNKVILVARGWSFRIL
jgi:hypothetical protein